VFNNYTGTDTYIGQLWTMPIELKGSFLVLGLLLLVGERRWRWLIYAALLGGFLAADSFYCLFIAGICLAELYDMGAAEWSGVKLAGIGLLLLGTIAPLFLPWKATSAVFLCGAVALCAGVVFCPMVHRLMETRISAFLGWISFPLYLMHGPVLLVLGVPLLQAGYGPIAVGLLLVPASFCAAIAFAPVNDLAVRLSRSFGTAVILLVEMVQRRIKLAN
jgi:peptidoglycan/LPS O-acetylase OafA/YrhL